MGRKERAAVALGDGAADKPPVARNVAVTAAAPRKRGREDDLSNQDKPERRKQPPRSTKK